MIGRYWHTLRHLRAEQVVGRIRFRLTTPIVDVSLAPELRTQSGTWRSGARRRANLTEPRQFLLLNAAGSLDDCGWDGPGRDKLWRYNQHYFDDLNALDAETRSSWHVALLNDWVDSNPPGKGVGWEPYPTSLRIVNWIKWALNGHSFSDVWRESLAVQTRWLAKRLEWHLLGNHLFANAKALVFAGLWFNGPEADEWLNKGFAILDREIPEQILPDGGQFELSPMYHALAVEDVLDLVNITQAYQDALPPAHCRVVEVMNVKVPPMLHWLDAMCHPDGEIAFFNDAAIGIASTKDELVGYAGRLGFQAERDSSPAILLGDSGYARLSNPNAVLLVDFARIGPDYLPGHAHADTLSFELSLYGQRLFVNSGASVYGLSEERLRQRGTAAHNTVIVGDENSSDVWRGFRVGCRAYPRDARVSQRGDAIVAEASHNGYCRLPGRPMHHRTWTLSEDRLVIEDKISAANTPATARYHLHPDVAIEQNAANSGICRLPNGKEASWSAEGGAITLEPATWHPEFGIGTPNTCLDLPLRACRSKLTITWI